VCQRLSGFKPLRQSKSHETIRARTKKTAVEISGGSVISTSESTL
jgi:hypothetical protein